MACSPKQAVVDLTNEGDGKDCLTTLPPELLHLICDYSLPTHQPNVAFEEGTQAKEPTHTLDNLAATCHTLRGEVNSWAQHYLKSHAAVTHYKDLKTTKLQSTRNFLRGKGGLLTWIEKHCIFCGKSSSRSAILVNGFRCCSTCDKEQWPDKITKTAARSNYDLKDHHLLPHLHPSPMRLKQPTHMPSLHYGTYMTSNVATTMFLEADVRRLADQVHGDWKEHMERKREAAEARKRAKEEKKAEAEKLDRAWAAQNTPFQLAAKEGGSQGDAAEMMEQLLRDSGVSEAFITADPQSRPWSLRMELDLKHLGVL